MSSIGLVDRVFSYGFVRCGLRSTAPRLSYFSIVHFVGRCVDVFGLTLKNFIFLIEVLSNKYGYVETYHEL